MVVDDTLYKLLGVDPSASEAELKKAFRKKALELHPDRNQEDPEATQKFQAVNDAYDILKDPEKREKYDRYGPDALKEGMGQGGADIFDFFFGGGRGRGRPGQSQRRKRTDDIVHELSVSLEDLYNGKEVSLKINRSVICATCSGSGGQAGKKAAKCPECGGQGRKVQTVQMGFMISQQVVTCPRCSGKGETISEKDKCKVCKGKKITSEPKKLVVHVERGMETKDHIKFQGSADESPDADTGDVVVVIKEKKHDRFMRRHDDLLIKKKITLSQALLGCSFPIKHLDERTLIVETPKGQVIMPNSVKQVDREGMPNRSNPYSRGSLFVHFEVIFPKENIPAELRTALAKELPVPNELAGIDVSESSKVVYKDSTMSSFESAKRTGGNRRQQEAYSQNRDDDSDEGQTMGCQPM